METKPGTNIPDVVPDDGEIVYHNKEWDTKVIFYSVQV